MNAIRGTALALALAPLLGACDVFYVAQARVALVAPVDTTCLRAQLHAPYRRLRAPHSVAPGSSVVAYSTPAMFHGQWEVVAQVARRDSSVQGGVVYRDSTFSLETGYVQVNRPIRRAEGEASTDEMLRYLLRLSNACGGRTAPDERLLSADVSGTPYLRWTVPGTRGRVSMRLVVEDQRYRVMFPVGGRYVLHVDTLEDSTAAMLRWRAADSLVLPSPRGQAVAMHCWRGDTLSRGRILAYASDTRTEYLVPVSAAWELDPFALRLAPTDPRGITCRRSPGASSEPEAPSSRRTDALAFHPLPGMARVYVYRDNRFLGDAETVAVDSQVVGRLGEESFLMVEVDPGPHRVSALDGRHERSFRIDAAPDSVYLLHLRRERRSLTWTDRIGPMDARRAQEQLPRARMAPSVWPGTPLRRRE